MNYLPDVSASLPDEMRSTLSSSIDDPCTKGYLSNYSGLDSGFCNMNLRI